MYLCAGSDSAGHAGIGGNGDGGGGGGGVVVGGGDGECAALARCHYKSSYSTACDEHAVAPNLIRSQLQTIGGTRMEGHSLAACMVSVSDR